MVCALVCLGLAIPAPALAFTFLVYGDSRSGGDCSGNAIHADLVSRMSTEPASLAFHTGDMITGYTNTTNWIDNGACTSPSSPGSFQTLIAPLQGRTPAPGLPAFLFPVFGNHDGNWADGWYPDPFGSGVCSVFDPAQFVPNHTARPYFHANTSNHPQLDDTQFQALTCSVTQSDVYPQYQYYAFDHDGTHFLVLHVVNDSQDLMSCNACGTDTTDYEDYYAIHQLDFVKWDLAQARANPATRAIFVLLHTPLFTSCAAHPGNASWALLTREFSARQVTAVFSGHCHVYERSVPIRVDAAHPGGVQDDPLGTLYFVTGGGGSPLHEFDDPAWFDAARSSTHHYMRVTVNPSSVTFEAVDDAGNVFDTVTRTTSCDSGDDCDDGLACNGVETCVATQCVPGTGPFCDDGDPCSDDGCAEGSGCTHAPAACDDANVCTADSCAPGTGCQHVPIPGCIPPGPPAVSTLVLSMYLGQVELEWDPVPGAESYRAYTYPAPGQAPNGSIGVPSTYIPLPMPAGDLYYSVVAVDDSGVEGPH